MATPQEHIDTIIANAILLADEQTTNATNSAQDIVALADGTYHTSWNPAALPTPEADEPDIPEVESGLFTFEAQRDHIIGLLTDKLAEYFATYYPLETDAFDEATNWLINTITNGGTGINQAIEDEIWQRGRDRLLNEAGSVQSQITSAAAARGIPLPDGATDMRLRQVRLKVLEETGQQSTTISTKQAEIEIETIKFAIGEAMKARFEAMRAAADFIRALVGGMNAAIQVAELNPNAKATMMNAVSNLYRARLSRDEIIINSEVAKRGQNRQHFVDKDNVHWNMINSKINAATTAAEVYAKTAQAALSSLNSIASTATSAFS